MRLETISRLTAEAKAVGYREVQAQTESLRAATVRLGEAGELTAAATQRQERAVLSAAKGLEQLLFKTDGQFRSEKMLEDAQNRLNRAVQQGIITNQQASNILGGMQTRFALAGQAAGNASHLVGNLTFQLNDIATGLITGQSPFMVMAQQGGQLSQILGANGGGLKGALSLVGTAAMSMVNPLNLAILGFGAAATAAGYFFSGAEEGADKTTEALERNAALLDRIKMAYGDAADAASRLGAGSSALLSFEAKLSSQAMRTLSVMQARGVLDRITGTATMEDPTSTLATKPLIDMTVAVDEFDQFSDAILRFNESVRIGKPAVNQLFEEIAAGASRAPDQASALFDIVRVLRDFNDEAQRAANREFLSKIDQSLIDPAAARGANYGRLSERLALEAAGAGPRIVDPNAPGFTGGDVLPRSDPRKSLDYVASAGVADPVAKAMDQMRLARERMQIEAAAMSMGTQEANAYRIAQEQIIALKSQGIDLSPQMVQAIEAEANAQAALRSNMDQLRDAQKAAADQSQFMGQTLEQFFTGIVQGGDAAKQAVLSLVAALARGALLGEGPLRALFNGGLFGDREDSGGGGNVGVSRSARSVLAKMTGAGSNDNGRGSPLTGAGSAIARMSGGGDVQSQVWDYFAAKGLKPHQIAGIVGNVRAESNFNPNAIGDNGKAFGLFQHWPNRGGGRHMLGDTQGQLDLAWSELMGPERRAYDALMRSTDVRGATAAFAGFERPRGFSWANPEGGHGWDTRLGGAEDALARFGSTVTAANDNLGGFGSGLGNLANALGGMAGGGRGGGGGGLGGILGIFGSLFGGGDAAGGAGVSRSRSIPGTIARGAIPSAPPRAAEGGPISIGGTTITVTGNADKGVVEEIDRRIQRNNAELARQARNSNKNNWRTG